MRSDSEFARGWPVVVAALTGVMLGLAAIPFYTLGLFAPPLRAAFGWSQGDVMAALSVMTLASIVGAPIAGLLANRYGARPIAIGSLLLFGAGFMALGASDGSLTRWYICWALLSLGGAGTLPVTWTRAITTRFDRRRGLALGLALMGTGLFGFFGKPLTGAFIARLGWPGAFVALGALPIVIAAPVALALFREGAPAGAPLGVVPRAPAPWTAHLGAWRLWLLVAALLPISFALAGPIPNMEAILRADGLAEASIRGVTPFIGLSALVGRVAGGWLLDRFWAPGVACAILCLPAIALTLLAAGTITPGAALLAIVLIGLAIGVEYDVVAFLVARYFPAAAYAPLYGIAYTAFLAGAGFAPTLFGRAFDRAGSFASILHGSTIGLLAGAGALLLMDVRARRNRISARGG